MKEDTPIRGGGEDNEYSFDRHDHDGDQFKSYHDHDVFGREEDHTIKYKTLSWPTVAVLMIAEIVSNGMLSLPYCMATIGIVPGVIVVIFLGGFATYTSYLLVQFKLRHPQVHTMGDAGYILFGPVGREVLAFGTLAFAIVATGSQLIAGQSALAALSDDKLCSMLYTGIFTIATLICSAPRTFDKLGWLSVMSVACIMVAGVVGMIGAGLYPVRPRTVVAAQSQPFYIAFTSVTNPVFAYAGHFMFFVLMSEMKRPQDAMKSAYVLQGLSTTYYILFAVLTYAYLGSDVSSPSFDSLVSTKWRKAAYGIALPNFLVAGALYVHTAAKLYFVRFFREGRMRKHLHENTAIGWGTWVTMIIIGNGAAFVLAVGVPIFNYIVGLAASLFASWFTYGIAGMFWLYDAAHDTSGFGGDSRAMSRGAKWKLGVGEWRRRWRWASLAIFTVLAGAFICVAGLYVTIRGIKEAYDTGEIETPFAC